MLIARQSTARTVTVGPVLDADGVAVTGGVVADVKIAKNGGAPAALNASATLTHRHTGYYSLALTASDLDTVGQVELVMDDTVNAMPVKEITVVEEAVYDINFASSATGAVPISTGGIAAAAFAAGAIDAAAIATGAIDADALAADAGTEIGTAVWASATRTVTANTNLNDPTAAAIADAVWDEATSGHTTSGTFGQREYVIRANTAQAGGATTITLDASASATDDIYNNQILVVTAGTGAGQSRIISDYNGTTKVATVPTWQTNPSSDSVFVILPFGAIPGATAPTAAEVADAVWDEAQADHVAAGSFGITASEIADILVDTAEIGAAGAGLTEAGGTGDHLTAIDLPDQTMNITGNITGNLSGSVGSVTGAVGSVTGAVGSVTGAVGSVTGNVGGNVAGSVGSVSGAVGSVTGNVGGNVTGSVGSLAAQAKADVNAEVVDALATDTYAEPGQGAPAATTTLAARLTYLYAWTRNKKDNDGTETKFYADNGTTVNQKQTTSESAGTVTKSEIISGV